MHSWSAHCKWSCFFSFGMVGEKLCQHPSPPSQRSAIPRLSNQLNTQFRLSFWVSLIFHTLDRFWDLFHSPISWNLFVFPVQPKVSLQNLPCSPYTCYIGNLPKSKGEPINLLYFFLHIITLSLHLIIFRFWRHNIDRSNSLSWIALKHRCSDQIWIHHISAFETIGRNPSSLRVFYP